MNTPVSFADRLAKFISIITSPYITTPVFGLWIIYVYAVDVTTFFLWGATFIACTILPTFLYVYFKVRSGSISDIHISVKEQRSKPFLISILGSVVLIGFYYLEHVPIVLIALAFVLFATGCVFWLSTFFSKISIHVAAYLGAVVILYRLVDPRLIFLLLILPLVIWARYKRERHDLLQSLSAGIIVVISVLTTLRVFGF